MAIEIIKKRIDSKKLKEIAEMDFGFMVKGVVDLNKRTIALGGRLHADAEELMLENGSRQEDLWGFNIKLDNPRDQRVEYTSFINIRPRQNNFSMDVKDLVLRDKIKAIIEELVE